jgi:chemotaxis protein methyltransferase CheR
VRPELRALVTFRRINLLDDAWPIRTELDVIMCRNVLIYFDRPTQQQVLTRLAKALAPAGLLCLGHSENVYGLVHELEHVGTTMYRRKED